ncbi:hypothetical protein BGX28_008576, partial [Mortierella sp. GBA30]
MGSTRVAALAKITVMGAAKSPRAAQAESRYAINVINPGTPIHLRGAGVGSLKI